MHIDAVFSMQLGSLLIMEYIMMPIQICSLFFQVFSAIK